MRRLASLAAALLLLSPLAAAQSPDAPVMGSSLSGDGQVAPSQEQARSGQILVLGDALAGGLGAGLGRVVDAAGGYEVVVRVNEESGLARPEVYDWAATLPKILESSPFDVIVVMLGANDRQTIRDGNMRYVFGTEEWKAAYGRQVDLLLDQLARSGARIIWVPPPPMADAEYDAAVRTITELQRQRVVARGLTFLDMRPEFSGPGGSYADTGKDDNGAVTRLRGRDGISFFKAGNNRMGQLVLAAIEAEKPAKPAGGAEGAGTAPEAPAKVSLVPLFGRAVMDAEPYTIQPEGVTANAIVLAGAGLEGEAALKTLRDIAPQGSGADGLFRLGRPAPAPQGRADDFAAPATP